VGQATSKKGKDAVQVSEEHGMGAHVRDLSSQNTRAWEDAAAESLNFAEGFLPAVARNMGKSRGDVNGCARR
jgi:hypothetical protein